jgi:hypothetical protein
MKRLMITAAIVIASTLAHAQDIDRLSWMGGNWVQRSAVEDVHENWLGPRGNVMVATNLTLRHGKGATFEFLRIGVKDGKIVYFASPGGRTPVEFPMAQMGESSIVFENALNPYPTRILYRREGDALVARIEGKRQGKEVSEEWRFVRAP